mmetsp:Transcript_5311/g.16030  ORF Transcript_5311/g.16030 Transcript_5311/m.16030 type:complete len:224 (-) Transcript_5311:366-1037(-)
MKWKAYMYIYIRKYFYNLHFPGSGRPTSPTVLWPPAVIPSQRVLGLGKGLGRHLPHCLLQYPGEKQVDHAAPILPAVVSAPLHLPADGLPFYGTPVPVVAVDHGLVKVDRLVVCPIAFLEVRIDQSVPLPALPVRLVVDELCHFRPLPSLLGHLLQQNLVLLLRPLVACLSTSAAGTELGLALGLLLPLRTGPVGLLLGLLDQDVPSLQALLAGLLRERSRDP